MLGCKEFFDFVKLQIIHFLIELCTIFSHNLLHLHQPRYVRFHTVIPGLVVD